MVGATMRLTVKHPPMRGARVRDVQTILTQLGFDTNGTDGKYGKKSRTAVRAFQKAAGLKADGIVGPQTYAALVLFVRANNDGAFGALLLALALHESAFQPDATVGGRRGLFMLPDNAPGNEPSGLTTTKQTDGDVAAAKSILETVYQLGRTKLSQCMRSVQAITNVTVEANQPSGKAPGARLFTLCWKLSTISQCLADILMLPAVRATGWAWSSIESAATASLNGGCVAAYQKAVGTGAIDRILAAAGRLGQVIDVEVDVFFGPKTQAFGPARAAPPAPTTEPALPTPSPAPEPAPEPTPTPTTSTPALDPNRIIEPDFSKAPPKKPRAPTTTPTPVTPTTTTKPTTSTPALAPDRMIEPDFSKAPKPKVAKKPLLPLIGAGLVGYMMLAD